MRLSPLAILLCLILAISSLNAQTDSNVQLQEGLKLLQDKDFESAVVRFRVLLQAESENIDARRGLAIALTGVEKFAEASREIAILLTRLPKDKQLLEMAGQVFLQQKRFTEAEIVLKRRLDLGEEHGELWTQLGDAQDAQKKTTEAASAYQNAVRMAPDSIDWRYALGALYWKLFRYEDAEREFLEILRRQPAEPRASFNLGDIYLSNGDAAKALPHLETAAKAFPDEFDTHFALGRVLLSLNKVESAIAEFKTAVKLRPEIPEGYFQLGRALQRARLLDEAKLAFKKTQELQNAKRASESVVNRKN